MASVGGRRYLPAASSTHPLDPGSAIAMMATAASGMIPRLRTPFTSPAGDTEA